MLDKRIKITNNNNKQTNKHFQKKINKMIHLYLRINRCDQNILRFEIEMKNCVFVQMSHASNHFAKNAECKRCVEARFAINKSFERAQVIIT